MSVAPQHGSTAQTLAKWPLQGEALPKPENAARDVVRLGRLQSGTTEALSLLLTNELFELAGRKALATVGEAADADRAYLFLLPEPDAARENLWFEWSSDHAPALPCHCELFEQAFSGPCQRLMRTLDSGRPVQGQTRELAPGEREFFERAAAAAFLLVPIMAGDTLRGFLGLEDCRRARDWKEAEISLLYMLAGGFHGAHVGRTEKRRVEQALRRTEKRLALAMSASQGGFWDAACESCGGRISFADECYISQEQKALIGYSDHEFPNSGQAWISRVLPEDLPVLRGAIQKHYEANTPFFRAEYRIQHKDGSLRWIEVRGKLALDSTGAPARCIGISWDVTERKTGEEERAHLLDECEQQRNYLETLIDCAPEGIAVVQGPEHRVMLANPVFKSVAAADPMNLPLAQILPNASLQLPQKLDEMHSGGAAATLKDYEATDQNGRKHWWDVRFAPLHTADGRTDAALVILLDTTDQVITRKRLAELAKTAERNYSQLDAVINSMMDGVIICAADGHIVRINTAGMKCYGSVTGEPAANLAELRRDVHLYDMSGQPVSIHNMPFSQVLAGQTIESLDLRGVNTNTKRQWIGCYNGVPIRDHEGQVTMAVVTVRDVTLYKAQERQLREWNETLAQRVGERTQELLKYQSQLRDLAMDLSRAEQETRRQAADDLHDWVAQDLGVCGWKLGMARKLVRSKEAQSHLAEAERLLSKSLAYTRTMISQLSPIALHEAGLIAALKYLGEQMMQYGLAVEVEGDCEDENLPEHEGLLVFQMVRELLFNVVKHAGVQDAAVWAEQTVDGLVVRVSDNGKGFSAQEDSKGSNTGGNHGLFSIRERLEALGGWLSVESSPGNGASATLFVPMHKTIPAALPDKSTAARARTRCGVAVGRPADSHTGCGRPQAGKVGVARYARWLQRSARYWRGLRRRRGC